MRNGLVVSSRKSSTRPCTKQQQKSIPADGGSNFREKVVESQLSRTGLGNFLQMKKRWSCDDSAVLICNKLPGDLQPIIWEEFEIAVAALRKGKAAGVDFIPASLVQAGGGP